MRPVHAYAMWCDGAIGPPQYHSQSVANHLLALHQTIILDMAGLSPARHFTLTVKRFLETLSGVDQNNYPEHLGCLFMINTPLLFRSFWSVIKGFLDERTLAKIKARNFHRCHMLQCRLSDSCKCVAFLIFRLRRPLPPDNTTCTGARYIVPR